MEIKKMELKKVKVFAEMSEETNCYVGTVYINGKPAIEVRNDGHGGCDMQYPVSGQDRTIVDLADEYCKKSFPATVFLFGGLTKDNIKQKDILYCDLEIWCGDQIQKQALRKEIKKLTTNKVAFFTKEGALYSARIAAPCTEAIVIANIKKKYGDVVILNELSPEKQEEALSSKNDAIILTPEEAAKIPA
jgi:hypothetical protein